MESRVLTPNILQQLNIWNIQGASHQQSLTVVLKTNSSSKTNLCCKLSQAVPSWSKLLNYIKQLRSNLLNYINYKIVHFSSSTSPSVRKKNTWKSVIFTTFSSRKGWWFRRAMAIAMASHVTRSEFKWVEKTCWIEVNCPDFGQLGITYPKKKWLIEQTFGWTYVLFDERIVFAIQTSWTYVGNPISWVYYCSWIEHGWT